MKHSLYSVLNEGTKEARIIEYKSYDDCIERLAPYNESLLESYVNNEIVTDTMLREELIKQIAQANVYPIFFGSAMTGIGVSELLENISTLLPAHNLSQDEKLSGIVFKIEREPSGEKIAYVRVFLVTYTLENMLIYSAISLYHIRKRLKNVHVS